MRFQGGKLPEVIVEPVPWEDEDNWVESGDLDVQKISDNVRQSETIDSNKLPKHVPYKDGMLIVKDETE